MKQELNSQNSQIEKNVKEFYEKYPYPFDSINSKENLNVHKWILNCIPHKPVYMGSIADIGCGTGEISFFLSNYGIVDGYDFSINSIKKANKNKEILSKNLINFYVDDITKKKDRKKYNYIFCIGVLHHIPNREKALENIREMMDKNSYLILSVYNKYGLFWEKHFEKKTGLDNLNKYQDHYNNPYKKHYTHRTFKSLIMNNGFKIVGEWRKIPDIVRILTGKSRMMTLCLKKI